MNKVGSKRSEFEQRALFQDGMADIYNGREFYKEWLRMITAEELCSGNVLTENEQRDMRSQGGMVR